MRKTIYALAAAAAALTSTIGMAHGAEQSFVHDGDTYVYTTKVTAKGQVIEGHRYPQGQAFHLVVDGKRVTGLSGGMPVSFKVAEARGAHGGIETAAR